jgi:hypothetical protein
MRSLARPSAGAARLLVLACACLAILAAAGSVSAATGPVQSLKLVSRRTVAPGVVYTHWRLRVSGVPDVQDVYRVSWLMGDAHVGLHAALMGPRQANGSVATRQISRWAALAHPRGLVAAMNGDFFTPTSQTTARPSGMIVRRRRLIQVGWDGHGGVPSVGFAPGGKLVFGRPTALPVKFLLPANHSATIAGFSGLPTRPDQVGAYTRSGVVARIPSGYTAVVLDSTLRPLRGHVAYTNTTGSGVRETVSAFSLNALGLRPPVRAIPIDAVSAGARRVTVPRGGAVLLMKSGGLAAAGFASRLALTTPTVQVTMSPAAWAKVTDVISGKPQVVTNGTAMVKKPSYVSSDQWYPEQFRPAIASSRDGHGWFIMIGSVRGINGTSLTGVQFARVLAQLGAKDALQLDNRHSTEIYLPRPSNGMCASGTGTCHTLMPNYERSIPEAAYLTYH